MLARSTQAVCVAALLRWLTMVVVMVVVVFTVVVVVLIVVAKQ